MQIYITSSSLSPVTGWLDNRGTVV